MQIKTLVSSKVNHFGQLLKFTERLYHLYVPAEFSHYSDRLKGTLLRNPDVEKSSDFYAFNDSTTVATFNFGELSTSGFRRWRFYNWELMRRKPRWDRG